MNDALLWYRDQTLFLQEQMVKYLNVKCSDSFFKQYSVGLKFLFLVVHSQLPPVLHTSIQNHVRNNGHVDVVLSVVKAAV